MHWLIFEENRALVYESEQDVRRGCGCRQMDGAFCMRCFDVHECW